MNLNYNFTDKTNILIFSKNLIYNNGSYDFSTLEKVVLTENKKSTLKKYSAAGFCFSSLLKNCTSYKGISMQVFKTEKNKFVSILHANFILSEALRLNLLTTEI